MAKLLKLVMMVVGLALCLAPAGAQDGRVALPALGGAAVDGVDAGAMAASQRMVLTLVLAEDAGRVGALKEFLGELRDPGSGSYRRWVTAEEFGARFGATAEQVGAARAWAEGQGLTVEGMSPARTRMRVSGYPAQVARAFAVELRAVRVGGAAHFRANGQASLGSGAAALFRSVEGLDDLAPVALTLGALGAAVDANAVAVLAVDATGSELSGATAAQVEGYAGVFQQAAAEGMTLVVARDAGGGFPAGLEDVTAVNLVAGDGREDVPVATRPGWQAAQGLPADEMRHVPDLTTESLAGFVGAVGEIARTVRGGRLGNVAPTLYALTPVAGVYAQAEGTAAGSWAVATGLGRVDLQALERAYPRGISAAALSVTSSSSNPVHGTSFSLTALVNSASGGAVPTGTVAFTSTNSAFPTTYVNLDAMGKATSAPFLLAGGAYPIVATYSGDNTYAMESATANVTVQAEAALFTISAPAIVALGSVVTATVALASASGVGTPSASITVTPSGITSAAPITQSVSGSGGTASAQFSYTTNKAGSVSLQASCTSADASFTCYTPQTATVTVPQATPGISLSINPATPVAGTPVTLTAPVTGLSGIAVTGSVQFFDGVNSIGFGSAPNATYSGLLLAGSTHVLSAVYQGDANYVKATSNTVSVAVGTAPTTTTVSASAVSAAYGQNVTLNIKVGSTTTVNGILPSGTVAFTGLGGITSAPVSGGATTLTLSNLVVGTYTITTAYSGDTNYAASTGNTLVLTVTPSVASLNPSLSTPSFTTGSSSTLTVTITLPGTALLATGSGFVAQVVGVTGATYPGTFVVNTGGNTGTGSVTIPAPIAGMYQLQVTCVTNANYTCVPQSLSITSTATAATAAPTATALTLTPVAPSAGQATVLTATVTASALTTPITGSVKFYDGTTLVGTGTLATVGTVTTATATTTFAGVGTHALTAVYAGGTTYATSTSPVVSITTAATGATVTLASSTSTGITGSSFTLTAQIGGASASGAAPTGSVSFYLSGSTPQLLGTSSLMTASGVTSATFTSTTLPTGTLSVYAVYAGDTNFAKATSNIITLGVGDYALTFVPPSSTITRGQSASVPLIVNLIGGFTGSVQLACLPPANTSITCGFVPATLTNGGTAMLVIGTTATGHERGAGEQAGLRVLGGVAMASLLCGMLPRRRRLAGLLVALVSVALIVGVGCGTNNFTTTTTVTTAPTPLGTVNLTINTSSTQGAITVRHDAFYQVTVQ